MATSGTWNFNATALSIITSAYEDINVIVNGQSIDANDLSTGLRTLNMLVKQWQGTADKVPGLKEFMRQRLNVFFVKGQNIYNIGPAATDDRAAVLISSSQNFGAAAAANFNAAQLTASKAGSATAITISAAGSIANGDQIGIVLSDGTIGWTTVSAGGGTTSLTLAANSLGAANNNANVFTYTSKAQRFVDIEAASLRDWSNPAQPIDIGVQIYTDVQQYEQLTQKGASGDPTAILVEFGRLNTKVTTNFATANVYKSLRLTVLYPSENYDDATGADDIAYPQEYYAALEWELARRCVTKFGKKWTPEMQTNWQIAVGDGVNLNPLDTHNSFEPARDDYDIGSPFTRP